MSEVDDIKSRLDIVDVIGQYMPLKKAGRNYKGLCPFHSEKTPSFLVSSEKQIFHCFGCGKGGDIFSFLMEKEGLSFSEALNQLAEKAGIELQSKPRDWGLKSKLFSINELAAKFFEKSLTDSQEGRQAMNYLVKRGINRDTIRTFRLGYASSGWEYLFKFLQRKDYVQEDIEKAGLIVQRRNEYSDKFRNRIIFPITNVIGKIAGFTGRVLNLEDLPKYLNSPETPVFNKSKILYGLSVTKEDISINKTAILVEGQTDVLSSYQAGVKNVIASSGTALTSEHIRLIRRYAEILILAMDADNAGNEATKRAIELASAHDLEIKVALLGKHKDPDDCIKAGIDIWKEIIANAVPVIDFYIKSALDKFGQDSIPAKKKVSDEVLSVIALLDSPVERDQYIKKLSTILKIDASNLYEALSKVKNKKLPQKPTFRQDDKPKTQDTCWLEKRILGILLYKPDYFKGVQDELEKIKWPDKLSERIYGCFKDCYTRKEFSLDAIVEKLDYQDKIDILEMMMVIEEHYSDISQLDIAHELDFYLNLLKQSSTKMAMSKMAEEIAQAEKSGNHDKLKELLEKFKAF